MYFKRSARNTAGTVLALILLLLGFTRRAKKKAFQNDVVLAIAFHNPKARLFGKILTWFQKNDFVFLSLYELIDIVRDKSPCPKGAVWISLDDGWKGNLDNVVSTAVKYNVPITLFIATGAVADGSFWWRKAALFPHLIPKGYRDIMTLKALPEEERKRIICSIDQASLSFPREAMTIDEVRTIATIPQVSLGAHTVSHPILPNCPESQLEFELAESKKKLEEWTGQKVTAFAYPNGSFDGRERNFLESLGYNLAVTTENRLASAGDDPYLFPRNVLMDDGSFIENLCHALGIWESCIRKIKRFLP